MPEVDTSTPADTPTPIGPYNHVAKVGSFITIGGAAGVDPAPGPLAGPRPLRLSITRKLSRIWRVCHPTSGPLDQRSSRPRRTRTRRAVDARWTPRLVSVASTDD